jgi:hypothetical protein
MQTPSDPQINSTPTSEQPAAESAASANSSALTKLRELPYREYLSNPWIAGFVGGAVVSLLICIAAFLTPSSINLPLAGDTSMYAILLGLAISMVVLGVTIAERRLAFDSNYIKIAVPSLIMFIVLCSLVQLIANPHLPRLYNNEPANLAGAMILGGSIPLLLFAILANRSNWVWFGIFTVVATLYTYIPVLIFGAFVFILNRMGLFRIPSSTGFSGTDWRDKENDRRARRGQDPL